MGKYDVDVIISARDKASAVFADVRRNAKREAARINRDGGGQAQQVNAAATAAASRLAFGGAAAAVAVATTAFYKGTQAALEYEEALARVNTMLSGDSTATMARYKEQLQEMSSAFGQSTTVLANGLYELLSAGVEPARAMQMLEVATHAATAGNIDAATSVDALTTVMNAYNIETENAAAVSDVMFQIVRDGKINFQQLSQNIATIAPMANAAGVSFDKLGALIATAVQVEKPERAMTQLSAVMRAAAKEGVDLFTFLQRFEGMDLSQILGMGVDSEAAKGIALLNRDAKTLNAELASMRGAAGATAEAFAKMTSTDTFKINQIRASWNVFLQRLGDGIIQGEQFGKVLDNSLKVIRNAPEYFNIALSEVRINFLETVLKFQSSFGNFGLFASNLIKAIGDELTKLVEAAGKGFDALAKGDFVGAGKAALQVGRAVNPVGLIGDAAAVAAERTSNDPRANQNAFARGIQQAIGDEQNKQAENMAKVLRREAEFARRVSGENAGDVAALANQFGEKVRSGLEESIDIDLPDGALLGGALLGDANNREGRQGQQGIFASAITSRFLQSTGAPINNAAGIMKQAGEKMLLAADKTARIADRRDNDPAELDTGNQVVAILTQIRDALSGNTVTLYGGSVT